MQDMLNVTALPHPMSMSQYGLKAREQFCLYLCHFQKTSGLQHMILIQWEKVQNSSTTVSINSTIYAIRCK